VRTEQQLRLFYLTINSCCWLLLQEAIRRALEENPELAEQLGEAAMAKVGG
jgi:hypothetical protein